MTRSLATLKFHGGYFPSEVGSEAVDRHETLIAARRAESIAVRTENPRHNEALLPRRRAA